MAHVAYHGIPTFPTKLPSDYVQRTLRRLLPSAAQIRAMTRDQLLKLAALKTQLTQSISSNPVKYMIPNPGGQAEFMGCTDDVRVFALFAGNKAGKTSSGVIRFMERMIGTTIWGHGSRSVSYPVPARGAIFAEDFDSIKETIVPTILSWIPRTYFKSFYKNNAGQYVEMNLTNGSVVHFRTYDQGSDKAEGKDWDAVLCDEPPPRDVYTAVFRGLVSKGGILIIAATLLKEAWLYDELEHSHVRHFASTIHDNPWISQAAKDDFLASLTDEERMIRESGKPSSMTGVIYPEFADDEPFVIEEDLEWRRMGWPIIMAVDPHERKPCAVEWAYVAPDDTITWFEYALPRGPALEDIREHLWTIESAHPSRSVLCVMDPNRGKAIQLDGRTWSDVFEGWGYEVFDYVKDSIPEGHRAMRDFLRGPAPRMRWTEACRGKKGPIYQMLRYSWEDWATRKMERDPKEQPRKQNKDFPDLHRYVAMADLKHEILLNGDDIIDRAPTDWLETKRAYA